jgi:sugar phosphate isomerase/epimerase
MQFGMYTATENAPALKAAGWDFVEENVLEFLQGQVPDEQWSGLDRARRSPLPVLAANRLLPAALKPLGPAVDRAALELYMQRVISRAAKVGMKTLVFGSGPARTVPDGFDRATAKRQILDFLRMACPIAELHGVLIVAEHMNRGECNIINSVAEAMQYVREINHPNFQCLVDSFHFWLSDEPLASLREAMPWIRHVHVSDVRDRAAPGTTGRHDYKALFRVLKDGGYDGPITVESPADPRCLTDPPRILDFLNAQWKQA